MAKFCPLFSGSKGNCTYIENRDSALLVDAGVSFKRIKEALEAREIDIAKIKAVLITHEHGDHVLGLKTLVKKLGIPVIASRDTVYALEFHNILTDENERIYADDFDSIDFSGFTVTRFATSHDCVGSSGYKIKLSDELTVAVCTDLGIVTDCVKNGVMGADLVMIESNHDPVMLRLGPYTPELKLRVSGEQGHLSNAVSAALCGELYKKGTRRFVLAHLSENNNTPEKAEAAVKASLFSAGARDGDYILYIAPPEGGKIISL